MEDNRSRLRELLEAYTQNTISEVEFDELSELVKAGNEAELKELFEDDLRQASFTAMDKQKLDRMLREVLKSSEPSTNVSVDRALLNGNRPAPVHRIHFLRYGRWWAAACVILALGIGGYFSVLNKGGKQAEIVKPRVHNDVKAPETNRAMITLANGQKIYLDSVATGRLVQQSGVEIVKLADGKIAYKGSSTELIYNTLTNQRGSKVIDMTLADGSRVWLNAGSSLTYPVAFNGNERKVSITGEAYFEVMHDAAKPFVVSKGETDVRVLGTHFNVNAYDDDREIKVTLLEGSVKVLRPSQNGKAVILKPGQQAQVSSEIKIASNIDIEEVMAWKNGKFQFGEAADISTIMRQVSRWYDVDIEYKGVVQGHIGGTISREVNVSQVFRMLEMTGVVTFQMDGKKVIVMPK